MDYEKNIEQLTQILEKLENEKLTMEQELELYRQAEVLYKQCSDYLDKAKGQILIIKKNINDYKEEKFISKED